MNASSAPVARLPFDIGLLHFVGIGGIGMSGIAEVMHNLGYRVQGSDITAGANTERLEKLGVPVFVGHAEENLGEAAVVVVSSAIDPKNPEVAAARARHLPIVRRAEMLAELMRLKWSVAIGGTHGKTTTTSLVAALMAAGGLDPTVINGGILNAYGTNAHLGAGDWMVVEADESDGTFVKLPATAAVVTNIDPEHLDHYGSFDAVRDAFLQFVENIPFYGFAALCLDHPEVQSLAARVQDRRVVTYGFNRQADVRGTIRNIQPEGVRFEVDYRRAPGSGPEAEGLRLRNLFLPMVGEHNVQNALAAIAVALRIGIGEEAIREGLAGFAGVKRRFTRTGEAGGITVIDDYGHHPVEIAAVLRAARSACHGQVIAVVQPHRYSRLGDLMEEFCTCFNDAEQVLVAPVYAAGEPPREGVSHEALVDGLRDHGHRGAAVLAGPEQLATRVLELAESGDMVVCLGAGTVTRWAAALPGEM
ncbi:MAG TPA: UDP-N-acetylmuramate--L-alanine ligase, partial [Alphaproteobacteria bacterium]|nr:UDP-N-acetylmuramate--L-alanine ligase [Alphaproteobacteria bacterium]